jgi:hypothetical protein
LSDILGSCGCGAKCWEEYGNSTVLGMCERCEIKKIYDKIVQKKQLQFVGVYAQVLFLYVCGVGDISIWVLYMA